MSAGLVWERLQRMPTAFGSPPLQGRMRAQTADFQVDEVLGFEPSGEGQHALLLIRKNGLNTDDISRRLVRLSGCRPVDVGFSGLKDRHAVTTQWFSVALGAGEPPDWTQLNSEAVQVLQVQRHHRKLRRGTAKGNRFHIRLTGLRGARAVADERLEQLRQHGAPNYFGEQRFGRDYGNVAMAEQLFAGQLKRVRAHQKGLYLSAARAQIFNQYVAQRVAQNTWNQALPGDLLQLNGSHAWFAATRIDADIERRIVEHDVHPSGPLWGAGALPSSGAVAAAEQSLGECFAAWCQGLAAFGLKQERRALRMDLQQLRWEWCDEALCVDFHLSSGCFATAALRELVLVD
jgi:tRNA pseudouridine13 synthase